MFASPSQVLCNIFGLEIYYYGIILAVALALGTVVSDLLGVKYFGLKKDCIPDMMPFLVICGIVGARLYYCLMDYNFYLQNPIQILAIRQGGLSIHGAILGGMTGLFVHSKSKNLDIPKLLDVLSIGLSLGQTIGRWGNFFNSEAFGTPTNLPWKLYIAPEYRPYQYSNYDFFHPTFLYESIADFIIFLLLILLLKKWNNRKNGDLALIYLILYSFVRIFTETIRIDSIRLVFGIPVAIVVSAVIIIVCGIVMFKRFFTGSYNK